MRKMRMRRRTGGTLIELLVALLLLDLALLSLAMMSAVAARRVGDAGRRSRSVVAASNRIERMAARPCGSMTGGSTLLERGVNESWSVTSLNGAAEITDSIDLRSRTRQSIVVRIRVPC